MLKDEATSTRKFELETEVLARQFMCIYTGYRSEKLKANLRLIMMRAEYVLGVMVKKDPLAVAKSRVVTAMMIGSPSYTRCLVFNAALRWSDLRVDGTRLGIDIVDVVFAIASKLAAAGFQVHSRKSYFVHIFERQTIYILGITSTGLI